MLNNISINFVMIITNEITHMKCDMIVHAIMTLLIENKSVNLYIINTSFTYSHFNSFICRMYKNNKTISIMIIYASSLSWIEIDSA